MHSPLFLALALPTLTKASWGYVGVLGIVGVALRAMRLASVRRGSAVGVLASTNRFQVVRIDATPNTAEVVNLETAANGSNERLIGEPMGPHWTPGAVSSAADPEAPIAVLFNVARPQPACLCELDEIEEAG
jgi:hypothetical protein